MLSDVQRLQYLRGSLKNEELDFLEGLETTAENYRTGWELLNNHYKNRRLIINTHLKELFEITPITKGNRTSIRQFVNHIRMNTKTLATLKLPVDQWDAILIYLATNKLDYHTRKEWKTHISSKGVNELPRIDELLEFLTGRYHMLEMVEKEKPTLESRKQSDKRHDKSVALAAITNSQCDYCKRAHRIFHCENLVKLPVTARIKIRQLNLCINCLRKGHWSKECKSSGCKLCKDKHNTLLHTVGSIKKNETQEEAKQENSNNIVPTYCTKDSQRGVIDS